MKEYEIVVTFLNGCAGEAHPQREFFEAELNDPADFVRQKHGKEFEKFTREDLESRCLHAQQKKVLGIDQPVEENFEIHTNGTTIVYRLFEKI